MALTLGQGAQLVADVGYQGRVRAAMVRAAIAVSSEAKGAQTDAVWNKRRQLSNRVLIGPDAWLPSFLAAIAADPNNSLAWTAPAAISSSTNANPSVVTTSAAHGIVVGDVVEIKDHAVNTNINGTWLVGTVGSTTTLTVPWPANGVGAATGWVMKMETDSNLVFTVNSVWSGVAGVLGTD